MRELQLPDYRQQAPEVAARFARIREREVVMSIENLGKVFTTAKSSDTIALKNINFQLHRREFVCVIGPSGCGKSTLIRILAGLDFPSSGRILVNGEAVSGPCPDRGMVFQGYTLFPWLTVKRNVMFGLTVAGMPYHQAEREALQWIDLVGLDKFTEHYPHQLSGGMKQRVAIARALANQPKVLLMDEPFGAVDAQTRAKLQAYLLQIWKNINITILFITHDLEEAIYLADRILVLKAHPGEVSEVIEVPVPRPRNPEQFISPEFLATKRRLEELIHPRSAPEPEEEVHIVRMTKVGDEVE
jgi:NitT/TauT family transport system ATP-binding protein